MQRLHQEDPSGFLLENGEKIRHIKLPGKIGDGLDCIPSEYSRIYVDGLLDPVRLSQEVLDSLRIKMGQYNYAGQIDQEPVPREGGLFSPEKFKIVRTLPDRIIKVVRSWDKAGTEGGGCNTAGVKMAELANHQYIVLDSIHGQWRAEKREAIILQTAELDGKGTKVVIEQEGGSGGKESAEATVRNLRGFTVEVDHPVGHKEMRAEPFATQVNIGNVYLLEGAWNKEYVEELRLFPRGKFKDQVDASSQAFSSLAKKGRIDYVKMMNQSEKSPDDFLNGIRLP